MTIPIKLAEIRIERDQKTGEVNKVIFVHSEGEFVITDPQTLDELKGELIRVVIEGGL